MKKLRILRLEGSFNADLPVIDEYECPLGTVTTYRYRKAYGFTPSRLWFWTWDILDLHYRNGDPKLLEVYEEIRGWGTKEGVNECDLAVVCVPTEPDEDGSCDTSIVEEVVSWIECPILIKSAVIPGTTDRLKEKYGKRIVVSPEYAGESKYDNTFEYFHKNMASTPWIVLGGDEEDMEYVYNILLPIVGPEKKWHFLKAKEAEMVKYFENTFFAFKVAIVNEFYDICKNQGVSWMKVREAWKEDPRISPMHTAVFVNERGFGGKCFPKDTRALCRKCEEDGYAPPLLKTMIGENDARNERTGDTGSKQTSR